MATQKEVSKELPSIIRVYKDGSVERLFKSPFFPPSLSSSQSQVSSKDITISTNPQISARLYLPNLPPNHSLKLPILVYYHGGAFCIGSAFAFFEHRYLNLLASQAKILIVSVEYRLAPENPLPVAYEDSWVALKFVASHSTAINGGDQEPWLLSHGNFDKLYIGGDSAGANIAHNLVSRAGVENLPNGVEILGAFLSFPCFSGSKPIGSEPIKDFDKSFGRLIWDFVFPEALDGADNPMINPVGEGLAGIGCRKLLVLVAGKDELRDRGVWYCDGVKESGWEGEVELFEVEDEGHCFHVSDLETNNAKVFMKRLASFLV
ncbi:hypothetical protein UlMin_009329 [Ulmus minor]